MELIAEGNLGGAHRQRLSRLLKSTSGRVRIASPYVTDRALILAAANREVQLVTSLSAIDVIAGATSLDCLDALLESGVRCKSLSHRPKLHAKVYVFGTEAAVVSSANLTASAFDSNIEVGVELRGKKVRELIAWFDRLWTSGGRLVNQAWLAELRQQTEHLRREYAALKRKVRSAVVLKDPRGTSRAPSKEIEALFAADRYFICNSNRRSPIRTSSGAHMFEQMMLSRGYAAAWERFKFEQHFQTVQHGDTIFLFAKGVGIIAIGRVTGNVETLLSGSAGRLHDGPYAEWRVPVDWIALRDADDAYPLGDAAYNFTFWNVSADSYADLRQRVREHFSD